MRRRRSNRRRQELLRVDREGLRSLTRRWREVLLLAGLTGAAVGLLVAGFDTVASEVLLQGVLDLPLGLGAVAPAIGLLVAVAALRFAGRGVGPATSDEYIRAFHEPQGRLPLRAVPPRVLAALATLGSGSPLGYEGPSLYLGAALGSAVQRLLPRRFTVDDAKLLLVAGAAAGVAAIFKAPLTGIVFALEVPYQEDLARRALLPASISAAASYVVFASIAGTEPILPVAGQPPFNLVDLGGAAAVGLVCGILARLFVAIITMAKRLTATGRPYLRAVSAGVVLGTIVLLGSAVPGGDGLTLGPGYEAIRWSLDPDRSLWAIVALGTLRVAGTGAAIAGGGVGGLFIPLVVQGALVGRTVGGVVGVGDTSLFPLVGMAAFLGAGYRVPLAAVVFVAESTGRPGFVVPGVIAAVVAQLVMGRASISPYQAPARMGHLERRLALPVATVLVSDGPTTGPDATLESLFWAHLAPGGQQSVPVVEGDDYLGIVTTTDLASVPWDRWKATTVESVMRRDLPVAAPDWLLSRAIGVMGEQGVGLLAVCGADGRFVGTVASADLVRLDELLEE